MVKKKFLRKRKSGYGRNFWFDEFEGRKEGGEG